MKPLVILTGPTAVGKTELSIKLAKRINAEIISADSMQVYKGMNIGSAKITKEEMDGVPHHLIDYLDFNEEFNIARFKEDAQEAIDKIYKNGHVPLIVGGTGFYIQSIIKDVDFTETDCDDEYRNSMYKLAEEKGARFVHDMLAEVDKEAAAEIHENNVKRVVRALEFYKYTGTKISEHNKKESARKSPYNYSYFVLNRNRETLYNRIDKRVDIMVSDGLLDEVKALKDSGATSDMVSMQGLGYKEILAYLNGDVSLDLALYEIKKNTRHFAKRQLTWFKREEGVIYIDADNLTASEQLEKIINELKLKGIIDEY